MDDPELVTLIPEEEPEQLPPPNHLGRKMIIQLITVVALKVATGFAIRNLTNTIRDFDILYPEHLSKIQWKK